jgi:LemA protein
MQIIVLGAITCLLLLSAFLYNRLVSLRERVRNAFAQVDVQLKRRYDLIPNLVEVVRGYMEHERDTLEAVIQARDRALRAEEASGVTNIRPGEQSA